MRWPVTKPAHVSHEIVQDAVLVLLDKIPNRIVEIKRRADGDRSDRDPDEPVQNGGVLHKSVPNVTNTSSCRAESTHSVDWAFCSATGLKAWPRERRSLRCSLDFARNDRYEMLRPH